MTTAQGAHPSQQWLSLAMWHVSNSILQTLICIQLGRKWPHLNHAWKAIPLYKCYGNTSSSVQLQCIPACQYNTVNIFFLGMVQYICVYKQAVDVLHCIVRGCGITDFVTWWWLFLNLFVSLLCASVLSFSCVHSPILPFQFSHFLTAIPIPHISTLTHTLSQDVWGGPW